MKIIAFVKSAVAFIDGYKTYLSAAGLFGLAVFQLSNGQIDQGIQSALGALSAAGIRHAVAKAKA